MKKQFLLFGISIFVIFILFCGCLSENNNSDSSNELKKFLGTWKHGTSPNIRPITFSSNGNCNFQGEEAKWEIENSKLFINFLNLENNLIFDYEFQDNNQILFLSNNQTGQVYDYIKQ